MPFLPVAQQSLASVIRMSDKETAAFQRALENEKLEAMAEFAAGAGHEINNPLTVISGRAQLLLREENDAERRHALALISAQAMRVHEMIADMMLFARPPQPELQRVDLVPLIEEIIAEFGPRCERQETSLEWINRFPGPVIVEADRVQIGVVLRAICRNALEALQSGGHVEILLEAVSARPDADAALLPNGAVEARIHIRDDGPGIKPEERRHLFDPFYSARQAGRGLGLGLSKAWRIVTNHGGRIEVANRPDRGAEFIVVLPSTASEADSSP